MGKPYKMSNCVGGGRNADSCTAIKTKPRAVRFVCGDGRKFKKNVVACSRIGTMPGCCRDCEHSWCSLLAWSPSTWCLYLVPPGTARHQPGTYQAATRYKHLVNEYLTAPTRLPHNSCRLSISVYTPPTEGEFKRLRGRAGSETSPGS